MKVTLVIPTYNRGQVLANTIDMALAQDYIDYEVIVVDQSSSPSVNASAYVESAGGRIRFLRLPSPNLPAARNAGVFAARGEIVIFIDDDVIIPQDYITSHVAHFRDAAVGGVMGLTLPAHQTDPEEALLNACKLFGASGEPSESGSSVTWVCGGNTSYRRRAIVEAGMADERYSGTGWCEDADLAVRVRSLGYKLLLGSKIRLVHLALPSGGCGNRQSEHADQKAKERLQLQVYYCLKNRRILGSKGFVRAIWCTYRAFALNRVLLSRGLKAVAKQQLVFAYAAARARRWCVDSKSNATMNRPEF